MTPSKPTKRTPEFKFFTVLSKNEIPRQVNGGRKSAVKSMPFWAEVEKTFNQIKESGAAPFEAVELDTAEFKNEKLKQPVLAVLQSIRTLLKEMKIESKIEVIRRGDRIFLVGA